MSIFLVYILFAVSVGLWACYELMWPVLKALSVERPDDVLVQNQLLAYVVMFSISTLTAPITVLSILVPSLQHQVIDQLMYDRD